MPDTVPVLVGTAGIVQGEQFVLQPGVPVVIGRSRSCDISLRRTAGYLKAPSESRDTDHDFNTVSRRHARVEVKDGRARVEDLSTNGTYVNGDHLSGATEVDLGGGACALRLGTRESFDLVLLPTDDPRVQGVAPVAPAPPGAGD
jgi:pSer/pThr/pTyr-binding forkhead associated (FHA) protein